jgi:4-hydroxythreonine-4-phosphate dehydrogenase
MTPPLPRILVTSGEPAGIGPDLCIELAGRELACELVVSGDPDVLAARAEALGRTVEFNIVAEHPGRTGHRHRPGRLTVHACRTSGPVQPGRLDAGNADCVVDMLDDAIDACARGDYDALVTAPVQKSLIADSGVEFTGHTEYLAARLGAEQPVMMLVAGTLRVALATTHLPLAEVSSSLSHGLLERVLRVLATDLESQFGIETPRIIVCALNPHAGESGHLGREEIDLITPLIEELRSEGLRLIGPAPADTAFTPAMLGRADAVLAMYHDQGLPVVKYAGFGHAVNVTLGLPIVRTSVDHGTALDLAASGRADPGSLFAAVELAIQLAQRRLLTA